MANKKPDIDKIISDLGSELSSIEGLHGQHPESGAGIGSGASYLHDYTNRIFGAPFQLLDSVDRRFPSINKYLGNEYLRNFTLNSPILHVKPGLPKYTGGLDPNGFANGMKSIYMDTTQGDMSLTDSLLGQLGQSTIFGGGKKLQKRMFGFRETYYDYMQHVNYMCRSMAVFLNLTEGGKFPTGTFSSEGSGITNFAKMKWENYRMLASSKATSPLDYLGSLLDAGTDTTRSVIEGFVGTVGSGVDGLMKVINPDEGQTMEDLLGGVSTGVADAWDFSSNTTISDKLSDKVVSVEFMVEPIQFTESMDNTTEPSVIESTVDSLNNSVGSEIAFITNSDADTGAIGALTEMLGGTLDAASTALNGIVKGVAGGFTSNLFSGAIQSIKGQKMIYPEIYKMSKSHMDYQFSITLTSPYGDAYNYYMNIVVPLMHLIALTAPRMVTSNTVTSPYLVQAYIPGMCTCQLGIISQMSITKNPSTKHVSVNGFPLTVKVEFTIKELYNAMSISPANDPASFLFNETLNDYMANLAGLAPSIDTYVKQRANAFSNVNDYLFDGGWAQDAAGGVIEKIEDYTNAFTGR